MIKRSCFLLLGALTLWACAAEEQIKVTPEGPADLPGPGPDGGAPEGDAAPRCAVGTSADPLVVATRQGLLRGKPAGDTVAFLGVPYAAPPVGALRFRPPAPPACSAEVRQAVSYGPACPQKDVVSGKLIGEEDCLSLNVWTPTKRPVGNPGRLPVLFFIHGGANILGASNQAILGNLYEGQDLAERQGVVVVSANYRLGALGFLAHPALSREGRRGGSGNWALYDQIAALTWVQENIAAFGGDPGRVMLFGESAGAFATCALMASPRAKGLFAAALMESGVCYATNLAYREQQGLDAAKVLRCDQAADAAACLRQSPVAELVAIGGSLSFPLDQPVDMEHLWALNYGFNVDGDALPDTPLALIQAGQHNRVPFVIGSNAQEMELFLKLGTPATCRDYEQLVRTAFGARADEVLRRYACGLSPRHAAVDLLTDLVFGCPARRIARAVAAQGGPVYRYYYSHVGLGTLSVLRAFHAAELPMVFNTFGNIAVIPTPGEVGLSRVMQGYWARFGATFDPNAGGAPHWERYDRSRDNALDLDVDIKQREQISASRCDFWDAF